MGRYGMRLGAARFVAGETLDECVAVLRRLADQGLHTNTTLLGESVRDRAEAEAVAERVRRGSSSGSHAEQLPCNVALKLTHLGLELDEELAYANVERVVEIAERLGSFVRIDMEQSSVVDATLRDLPPAARGGSRPGRHRAPGVPLPHRERPRVAAPARAEPALREGRLPRAARDRLPGQGRRRRGVLRGSSRRRCAAARTRRSRRTTRR